MSRRRFLQAGSTAAVATIVPGSISAECKSNLPPSIASLKSMKDQAVPITVEERKARVERAGDLMAENTLQAIVITSGSSLTYYSAVHWWTSERLFAMVLPAKGKAFFVCPAFEEGRAREQLATGPFGSDAEVRIWQEDEDPYLRVAQGLRDLGLTSGVLGIEEKTPFVFSDGIAAHIPALQIASATPVTAGCRMIKSDHEISLMRLAANASITAYEAAYRALKVGMTQNEFEGLVESAHTQLGFHGGADVQVGPHSAAPHGSIASQKITEGTIVMMDGGCSVEGYASDITRTFVLGKPTDKMKRIFDIVHQAQSAALAAARPGVECQAVDAAARKVVIDAGYGTGFRYFTHRLGHGMGLDGHEWPYLVPGNTTLLRTNMTFSDEPGIYIPGEFGVRIEDDMHILAEGAELFSPRSPSLEHPFGTA
ncbi:MAG TPA: Xaa-Pro peptidase family protein [Candidatus Eisenbacteria bacterium]|nr:Xaa-Pro peptidase family protein [Candidatus Eisenbacteria bacterium]